MDLFRFSKKYLWIEHFIFCSVSEKPVSFVKTKRSFDDLTFAYQRYQQISIFFTDIQFILCELHHTVWIVIFIYHNVYSFLQQ